MKRKVSRSSGWRSFLTPSWALTFVLVVAFSYLAITVFAPWQLNKNTAKSATNHRLEESFQRDPVPVEEIIGADGGAVEVEEEWTHVTLTGEFDADAEVVVRNRPVDGTAAFQMLTPLRLDDGLTVLVNRGWVASQETAGLPQLPDVPGGKVEVSGFIRLTEHNPSAEPAEADGHIQVNGFSTEQVSEVTGVSLATDYVQLDEASVEALNERIGEPKAYAVSLPQLDNGPHLSYGIQWVAFGIIAPVGLIWFVRSELRERRRELAEQTETASGKLLEPEQREAPGKPVPENVRKEALAARYGRSRNRTEEKRQARKQERF